MDKSLERLFSVANKIEAKLKKNAQEVEDTGFVTTTIRPIGVSLYNSKIVPMVKEFIPTAGQKYKASGTLEIVSTLVNATKTGNVWKCNPAATYFTFSGSLMQNKGFAEALGNSMKAINAELVKMLDKELTRVIKEGTKITNNSTDVGNLNVSV